MEKGVLETQYVQRKELIRGRWSKLTEDDVRRINGNYELLIEKLQQRYGYSTDQAEEEVRRWNNENGAKPTFSTGKSYTQQGDKTAGKQDNSSFFKWLLAIAIPLLLLGLYFGSTATTETTATNAAAYDEVTIVTQTPSDQTLAQNIRQALSTNNVRIQDLNNVQFSASNGVIGVSGTVPNIQTRDTIVTILQRLAGNRPINNQLQIRP